MSRLYIVCGIPGAGKSTTIKEKFGTEITSQDYLIISRDKIRFGLLKDGDAYFEHEPIVEEMFYKGITKALRLGYDVVADQSSINPKSRKKLINKVAGYTEINAIWVDTPIEKCIERDSKRTGWTQVGEKVIKKMAKDFIPPYEAEGFANIYRWDNSKDKIET